MTVVTRSRPGDRSAGQRLLIRGRTANTAGASSMTGSASLVGCGGMGERHIRAYAPLRSGLSPFRLDGLRWRFDEPGQRLPPQNAFWVETHGSGKLEDVLRSDAIEASIATDPSLITRWDGDPARRPTPSARPLARRRPTAGTSSTPRPMPCRARHGREPSGDPGSARCGDHGKRSTGAGSCSSRWNSSGAQTRS